MSSTELHKLISTLEAPSVIGETDHNRFAATSTHVQAARDYLQSVLRRPNARATPDVSLIVTFHHEGLLAVWSLQGLERLRTRAKKSGVSVQFIAVLDRPDKDTYTLVCQHPSLGEEDWLLQVDAGDPATSRNIGVLFAEGHAIAVADGDDFYSEDWIVRAWELVQKYGSSVVVHPEYIVSFERQHVLHRLIDQRRDNFPLASCIAAHPWGCATIAHTLIFKTTPYLPTRAHETGFGYEDWHWNLEVLSKGVLHICAESTAHYYRRRTGSVLNRESNNRAILRPSGFFASPEYWETGFPLIDVYREHAVMIAPLAVATCKDRADKK